MEAPCQVAPSPASQTHLLVFRPDTRVLSSRAAIVAGLQSRANGLPGNTADALELLLRSSEIECALDDQGLPSASAAALSDLAAAILISRALPSIAPLQPLLARAVSEAFALPETVLLPQPEGYCYYALHPLDFAAGARNLPVNTTFAVIGIRTIGASLSAMVAAALGKRCAGRITVRPQGHPYDRRSELSAAQASWVTKKLAAGAHFFVVDEGPGLSGSSFLSVAEA